MSRTRRRPTSVLALLVLLAACEAKQPAAPAEAEPDAPAKAEETKASEDAAKAEVGSATAPAPSGVILDHEVKLLDGSVKSLADYRGKALLVVNTASECGFTPQYAELQQLYATYAARGLEVLAFPSNDFGAQEPGTPEEIRAFVDGEYSVEFEMFEKVATKGPEQSPLYKALTEETGEGIAGEIKWNFTKFLVDPQGRVLQRFEPPVTPMDATLVAAVEAALPSGS